LKQEQALRLRQNEATAWRTAAGVGCQLAVECEVIQEKRMNRIFHPFRSSSRQLGPLEQRLLDAMWARGSATVRELVEHGQQDLAYTTVMTTLDRLYKKNVLKREAEGRAFRYAPRFSREELHREVAGHAFRQLLDASPASSLPLSFLVEILSERDEQLLDDLWKLVERKRRELAQKEKE
jgi:predicted transcriptional regulator